MCDMICTCNDFLSFHGLQALSPCQHEVSHEITCGVQNIMFGFLFIYSSGWFGVGNPNQTMGPWRGSLS